MKTILTIILLLLGLSLWAQEDKSDKRPFEFNWQINALSVGFKGNVLNSMSTKFTNSSILSKVEMDKLDGQRHYSNSGSTLLSFGVGIPIKFSFRDKFLTTWRLGGDYFGNISIGDFQEETTYKRLDSTYYPEYNASLMKDSVYFKTIGGTVKGIFTQLKTDWIFRFRPNKRFTFFAGIGLGLGITSNRTSIFTYKEAETEKVSSSLGFNYNYDYHSLNDSQNLNTITNFQEEKTKLKTLFSSFAYLPYGMDWQIGKNGNFAKRFHVYYEGQIGARFVDAFLGTSQTNFYFSNAIGLRLTI